MKTKHCLHSLLSCLAAASILVLAHPAQAQVFVYATYGVDDNTTFTVVNNYRSSLKGATISGRGFGGNLVTGSIAIPNIPSGGSYVYTFNGSSPAFTVDFDETFKGQAIYTLTGTVGRSPLSVSFSPIDNEAGRLVPFLGNGANGTELDAIVPFTLVARGLAQPIQVVDIGAIYSTVYSGLPMALAQHDIVLNLARTATRDVGARLFLMRAGLHDEVASGSAGPTGPALVKRGSDGKVVAAGKDDKATVAEPFRHFELFATGDFGAFDVDDVGAANGYGQNVWVGTAGAEYRVNRNVAFGLAGSYINSSAEISKQVGSSDAEGAAVSAYGSAVWRSFYVDLLYSFGSYEEDIQRHTLVGRTARGSAESHTNTVQFNTGYTFKIGDFHTGPLATVDWVHGDLHSYREQGGGSAALDLPGQHFDSLLSRIGWQVSYTAPVRFGTITPQIRASWDHEYLDSSQLVSASLQQSPFATITGANVTPGQKFSASAATVQPGRDYLTLAGGVAVQFGGRWSATLEYETHIFQDSATAHLASAKVNVSF